MLSPDRIKSMAEQWLQNSPLKGASEEVKMMASSHFQQWLVSANLVTRDEFDAQCAVLERTHIRLQQLEQQVEQLQQQLSQD